MDEEFEEKIDYYMSIGVVELVGVDEDGEIVYEITDKAETEAPELWAAHIEYVDRAFGSTLCSKILFDTYWAIVVGS